MPGPCQLAEVGAHAEGGGFRGDRAAVGWRAGTPGPGSALVHSQGAVLNLALFRVGGLHWRPLPA